MKKLLKMLFGGIFLAYFVYGLFSGGVVDVLVFAAICLVFFVFVWTWEVIERKIKSRKKTR